MLTVSHLACTRGEKPLFTDVSFSVQAGQWLHLQGNNGSGKTSLLRIVCGLSPAAGGEVAWNGIPITQSADDYRRDMFYLGHHLALKEDLSALENLQADAGVCGRSLDQKAALDILSQMGLRGREDLPVRVLSQGQKRRAALSRLLASQAALWVLDEPFVALDAAALKMLEGVISQHVSGGGMALLTSHQPVQLDGHGLTHRLSA